MSEESIEARNSMREPYRYWTEQAIVVTKDAQDEVSGIREQLQEKHKRASVDVWQMGEKYV